MPTSNAALPSAASSTAAVSAVSTVAGPSRSNDVQTHPPVSSSWSKSLRLKPVAHGADGLKGVQVSSGSSSKSSAAKKENTIHPGKPKEAFVLKLGTPFSIRSQPVVPKLRRNVVVARSAGLRGKERRKKKKFSRLKLAIKAEHKQQRTLAMCESIVRGVLETAFGKDFFTYKADQLLEQERLVSTPGNQVLSKKFRSFMSQMVSEKLNAIASNLLSELVRFQKRTLNNPFKARTRRRYVIGLRETLQKVKAGLCKCVILVPDLPAYDALDVKIHEILSACRLRSIPVVFALSLRRLGRCMGRPERAVKVSCVCIQRADGAEELFKKLLVMAEEERLRYSEVALRSKPSSLSHS
eukprot:ANDGO_05515.mRNA.1 hypothetical protein